MEATFDEKNVMCDIDYPKYGSYAAVAQEIRRSASAVARYVKLQGTPKVVKHAFREVVRR